MSECVVHRERLLEASPTELRRTLARVRAADSRAEGVGGDIDSARFETHLASCPRCLAAAERVAEGLDALDVALDDRSSGVDPVAILERARATAGKGRSPWARSGRLAAALLAAAAVALVFLRPPSGPSPHPPTTFAARTAGPDVEAPAGRNVAVLATDNPDITVLWIF